MSDPVRSIIQTQHPRLADEVKDAIAVMEKVLQIAGESVPRATPKTAAPKLSVAPTQGSDYEILATHDTELSSDGVVQATVDTQAGKLAGSQVIKLASGEAVPETTASMRWQSTRRATCS